MLLAVLGLNVEAGVTKELTLALLVDRERRADRHQPRRAIEHLLRDAAHGARFDVSGVFLQTMSQ